MSTLKTISRKNLEQKLTEMPNNVSERDGFALVNVLGPANFAKEHIPGSINIPVDEVNRFESKFSKDKEIIVYCASPDCDASPKVAQELMKRGFVDVHDYEEGMSDWKRAGNAVEGSEATGQA